ncbi:MAG: PD-(D/E)XK nuclease domain-containing protein [Chitinophagales bacterium]
MWEGYFHTIIYLITSFLKLNVQSEIMKHKGRLDLVVQTKKFLYIMEFKLANSSKNAIKQIKQRDYALSYKNSKKTIYLLGINFNKKERNVKDWQTEIWT